LRLEPGKGKSLADLLFAAGAEFPCAGEAGCGGCRIRVLDGEVAVTAGMRAVLSEAELAAGWRLGCQAFSAAPLVIEVGQWAPAVLTDEEAVRPEPREGFGIAIDLGTTTLAVQRVNLETGAVSGVRTALNPQARHGADIMSRVAFELRQPGVQASLIREELGAMAAALAGGEPVAEVLLCGNTVMHHLFCGLDVAPLAAVPFETSQGGQCEFDAAQLGWRLPGAPAVRFLPCLGGFAGSDLLAGMAAVGVLESRHPVALVDLGTNGEIVLGSRAGVLCASTAAGPAFEAGGIGMGMRAEEGAIHKVRAANGRVECEVLGHGEPRGVCGSGLVAAAAAALELGWVAPSGRLHDRAAGVPLAGGVRLTQADLRELQLAKAAIACGLQLLERRLDCHPRRLHLAGAFGNYVDVASARRIGLLPPEPLPVEPVGNAALRGTRMLLAAPRARRRAVEAAARLVRHVGLASEPGFEELYVASMPLSPVAAG
jgi:uncharacterized 2Fe-2S/4Fe-4S cluster protein (DUF4445 family)